MAIVTPSVIRLTTSAMRLTSRSRALRSASAPGADWPGVSPMAIDPTSGTTPATVSQGKLVMDADSCKGPLEPYQQQGANHCRGTDEHEKRVRADEAGLELAQPSRTAAHDGRDRSHQPVDALVVGEDRQPHQPQARPHQHRLVERVAVEVLAGGNGDQAAAGRR